MKRVLIIGVVIIFILVLSVNFVSAAGFWDDFLKNIKNFFVGEKTGGLKGELATGPKSDGLIHYYNFDSGLNDLVGSAHFSVKDGNIDYVNGRDNKAVKLDIKDNLKASNSEINIPDNVVSIAFWINFNSIKTGSGGQFIDKKYYSKGFVLKGNSNGLEWWAAGDGDGWLKCNIPDFVGKWHHITVTAETSSTKKIYANGKLCSENKAGNGGLKSSVNLALGNLKLNGIIDELSIWNRILTNEEIKEEYERLTTCTPNCLGKKCGDDGCGGSCGSCASGESCSNGECVSTQTCTDECSSGQKTCSGNGYKTCGNYDSDSCLEWSTVTNCASGESCSSGVCVSSQTCTDSDGGKSPNEKGILLDENGNRKEDYCKDINNVWEYYCDNGRGSVTELNCQNGCKDGACVEVLNDEKEFGLSSDNPTRKVDIKGSIYTIELVSASDSAATIKVTNNVRVSESKEIFEYHSKKVNGINVLVISADETNLVLSVIIKVQEQPFCKDSDVTPEYLDGKNYYAKGFLNYTVDGKTYYKDKDWCSVNKGNGGLVFSCSGLDCTLIELICSETTGGGDYASYNCPNGCKDGACVASVNQTNVTCTDSDGGLDYFVKGNIYQDGEIIFEETSQGDNNVDSDDELIVLSSNKAKLRLQEGRWIDVELNKEYDFDFGIGKITQINFISSNNRQNNIKVSYTKLGDYCFDNTLIERDCRERGDRSVEYACPNSCQDGECVEDNPRERIRQLHYLEFSYEDCELNLANGWNSLDDCYEGWNCLSKEFSELVFEEDLEDLANYMEERGGESGEIYYFDQHPEIKNLYEEKIPFCVSGLHEDFPEKPPECTSCFKCEINPLICPPHGRQTQICVDECCDKSETREEIFCSVGECSGCFIPRWSGAKTGDNICIPYGTRLLFKEGDDFTIYGNEFEEEFKEEGFNVDIKEKEMFIEVIKDIEEDVSIIVNGKEYNLVVGETFTAYEGETYEISIIYGDYNYKEDYSVTINDIYYSENPQETYIKFTINNKYPTYCDYDGDLKQQRTVDYQGNWAECQNNYECESNLCSSGECIEITQAIKKARGFKVFFIKIMCKLGNLFDIEEYNQCVVDRL